MKFKKVILLVFGFIAAFSQALAQDGIEELFENNVSDAEKLVNGYISPFMKSVSSGLNQGWYNTAKPHKIVGVDLTITVNAMSIPKSEMFYNVNDLKLSSVELNPNSPDYPNAPTIFGAEREPDYRIKNEPNSDFEGPPGIDLKKNIGLSAIPVPMAQLGIGLPKGTDIKFRFVPQLDIEEDGTFNLFGIGVMHDVKQWIPGIKNLPFDLSGFAGYTRLKLDYSLEDEPLQTRDAKAVVEMSALTFQGIISKKISVLTVYGALGYNVAKSKLAMQGSYNFNDDGDFDDPREKNPFTLNYSASGPRMTAGFRLKLAVLTLHADYTLQKYNCLTVGLGISVR